MSILDEPESDPLAPAGPPDPAHDDYLCRGRRIAYLFDPDDPGLALPCPTCVEHVDQDKARVLRSASAALTSGRW